MPTPFAQLNQSPGCGEDCWAHRRSSCTRLILELAGEESVKGDLPLRAMRAAAWPLSRTYETLTLEPDSETTDTVS